MSRCAKTGRFLAGHEKGVADQFDGKWVPEPNSGCWLWLGSLSPEGYARIRRTPKTLFGHRVGYEIYRGQIPSGLELDHLCRTTSCVNPWHLEAVAPRINKLRGTSPPAKNARKTHCPYGHELEQSPYRPRWRWCRVCHYARCAARKRRMKRD